MGIPASRRRIALLDTSNSRNFRKESWYRQTSLEEALTLNESALSSITTCLRTVIAICIVLVVQGSLEPKVWPSRLLAMTKTLCLSSHVCSRLMHQKKQ